MMVMILALLAGCVPSLIIFIRKNKSNPKYSEPLEQKNAI
jgi:hypothetical protein